MRGETFFSDITVNEALCPVVPDRKLPTIRERALLSAEPTSGQLRERAGEYRRMAETATSAGTMDSLLRLAERYESMADGP